MASLNKLVVILTAPMARHPFLFLRKLKDKLVGGTPCQFQDAPVQDLNRNTLEFTIRHLHLLLRKTPLSKNKLYSNEVFKQKFDTNFLLQCCERGPLTDDSSLRGDVKLPWEFSRGYSYVINALLCRTDADKEYCAEEAAAGIRKWLRYNADPNGVNWLVSMEVGIRAFNWVCADALLDGGISRKVGVETFTNSLWNHGIIIWNRLEYYLGGVSNHYTADLLGLAALGSVFPETPDGKKWLRFANREMQTSIVFHQTYPDGGLKESSLRYHGLVTEMCLYYYALVEGMVGERFKNRLIKMCQVVAAYRDSSNGDLFAIGDDDGGRIIPLDFVSTQGRADILLTLARELLDYPLEVPQRAQHQHSGWAVLRRGGFELVAEYGSVKGGHAHNDTMSFCLNYEGVPVFSDPGSGIYTPDIQLRNQLRGMTHHSVVQIDDSSQGDSGTGILDTFAMDGPDNACKASVDPRNITITNTSPAYGMNARHERILVMDEVNQKIHITDKIWGAEKKVTWRFVLDPGVRVEIVEGGFFLQLNDGSLARLIPNQSVHCSIVEGRFSNFYGHHQGTNICQAISSVCIKGQCLITTWSLSIAMK